MFRKRSADKLMDPVWQKSTEHRKLFRNTHPAISNSKNRQNDQRCGHGPGCFLSMFRFYRAWLAEEGQRDLAHRVEGGQECGESESNEDNVMTVRKCICKNFILRPEPCGDDRETGKSKTTDQEGPECNGHLTAQSAHIVHILRIHVMVPGVKHTMFHAVDDRTRAEEEQCFEKRMC